MSKIFEVEDRLWTQEHAAQINSTFSEFIANLQICLKDRMLLTDSSSQRSRANFVPGGGVVNLSYDFGTTRYNHDITIGGIFFWPSLRPCLSGEKFPGKEAHPNPPSPSRDNFNERLYEIKKVGPFARANRAHTCSNCLAWSELTRLGEPKKSWPG